MARQRKTWLSNLMLVVLAVALTLGLLEGLARLLAPGEDAARRGLDLQHFSADRAAVPDPLLGYRLKRNMSVANYRFNNLGFVGADFQAQKPAGVFRIFCLGGSTTLGAGADSDRYSYPALLGAIFRKTDKNPHERVEVVNAGVFGYHSWHTLLRVENELPAYAPDYYVVMDGLNDVMAACTQMTPEDLAHMRDSMDAVMRKLVAGKSDGVADAVRRRLSGLAVTRLAARVGRALGANDASGPKDDYARRMARFRFRENLDAVLAKARADGIGVLVVNHPWIMAQSPQVDAAMGISPDLAKVYTFGRAYVAGVDRDVTRARQVPLADPQPLFDRLVAQSGKPRLIFSDTVHFTRRGNFELAKLVYAALMADPDVQRATGRDAPVDDAALDALFPAILAWRPNDGSGWPTAKEPALPVPETALTDVAAKGPDGEGTATLAPTGEHGAIRLRLADTPPQDVFFYPRVSGDGKSVIRVQVADAAGKDAATVFTLDSPASDGIWTAVSGRYDLPLPQRPGLVVTIELSGHDAQIWTRNGHILFHGSEAAR
jgi:lysophospholipase L1-like esterase